MWCYCSFVVALWKNYFILEKDRKRAFSSRRNASKSVHQTVWTFPAFAEIAIPYSTLHFSNNNIHGSINDDEFIKNARRFLKIYPRETSRRKVKLWSGLSRYFDIVNEFCFLSRTEKKGDRSFVRSFVIIQHDDACTHQSRCCSWHWHFFFFFFFL